MRLTHKLRHLLLTGCLAAPLIGLPAPAQAGGCGGDFEFGEYLVAKIVGDGPIKMGWVMNDPIPPTVDDETYTDALVAYVWRGTGPPRSYVLDMSSSGAPRVIVRYDGQTVVEESLPHPWRYPGIHGTWEYIQGAGLGSGINYLVVYATGPRSGSLSAAGVGGWSFWLDVPGATCTPMPDVQGEIIDYNHTHFEGPTNIYAASVGVGMGLSLEPTIERDIAFGYMFAERSIVGQRTDLRWTYPGNAAVGSAAWDYIKPYISFGPQRFELDYYGLDPMAHINYLQLDRFW
jgi:hypothetical protein